jgi:branched-chain amino acid transport system permease protein
MLSYLLATLVSGGIFAILALSLNLAWGGAGMVNLGLAGFFAIGAYASALATQSGAPFVGGLAVAVLAGMLAGIIVTFATLRLRDDYLAIVTLGFAEVIRLVALNERWLTKGAEGLSGIAAPLKSQLGLLGFDGFYLTLTTGLVALIGWGLRRLDRSPYGRALRAIREDPELARFAGKTVLRFKFEAFALSAAIAALAGALYAHFQSYISPDLFAPLLTIYIFLAVTAGGVGRPAGAVLGGYAVLAFLEAARFGIGGLPWLAPAQLAAIQGMLTGVALLLVLRLRPRGLLPETIQPAPRTPV